MMVSCMAGDDDVLYGRRWWCLVWPETVMSCMAGDGNVLYGRRLWSLVWPETVMSRMAGDDCWLWYGLMAFSRTCAFIYIGLVALLDRIQSSFCKYHYFNNTIFLAPTAYQAGYQAHLPLCWKVPGIHCPLWMESRVYCILCRWKRSQGGSGEGMKATIKCEDCIEALCFTPKQNCFYEFHHMLSIFIYSGGIWLDCGCVMCILKGGRLWARTRLPAKG